MLGAICRADGHQSPEAPTLCKDPHPDGAMWHGHDNSRMPPDPPVFQRAPIASLSPKPIETSIATWVSSGAPPPPSVAPMPVSDASSRQQLLVPSGMHVALCLASCHSPKKTLFVCPKETRRGHAVESSSLTGRGSSRAQDQAGIFRLHISLRQPRELQWGIRWGWTGQV